MQLPVAALALAALMAGSVLAPPCHAQAATNIAAPVVKSDDGRAAPVVLQGASMSVEEAGGSLRTTLDMTFRNTSQRVLEGNLDFPLEPGQQVVAFALDIGGHMRDAVPVEKQRGRQVLEAIERRGADPGLLEQTAGNHFRLRVYPFAPQGARRVRIVIAEALMPGTRQVRLPTVFAAGLGELPLAVIADRAPKLVGTLGGEVFAERGRGRFETTLRAADPARGTGVRLDLGAPTTPTPAVRMQEWHGARYFSADVPITLAPRPRALPSRVVLLWDSSASGAKRAHDLEFALLDAYFQRARSIDVELVRFRDVSEPAKRFHVVEGDWSALRRSLENTTYDGATSLRGWTPVPGGGDVLLFSDGLFNYGDTPFPTLDARQRLYAITAGVAGDAARLAALAEARGGEAIALAAVADLADGADALLQGRPRLSRIDTVGAQDVLAASAVARGGIVRIAGRLDDPDARVSLEIARGGDVERIQVPLAGAVQGGSAASTWAAYRVAQLMESPARNRAAIERIGADFGIVTPGSSLIVLEDVADYVRYSIAPPDELRAEYAALVAGQAKVRVDARAAQLEAVREEWKDRITWWSTAFPKNAPPKPKPARHPQAVAMAAPAPAGAAASAFAPSPRVSAESANSLDRVTVTGSRISRSEAGASDIGLRLEPWTPDSPFARRLRGMDADAGYAAYLDERSRAAPGTAFYLDVADVLFEHKRADLALRVLSNLAELDLDNRHVLRVLAYRLMQAGRADLAVPVLEQVLSMSDDEPQSFRDLAHAHAALGNRQKALDLLYEVVTGTWDGRFPGIEVTALAELNALRATSPIPLDTHRIPTDLVRNMPLDLRAVLSWDADNSDMDLWVTDPNGEKAYYSNRLTYQGGHISPDFTGGYGPEEFALRTAKPGRYKVEANYFGDSQQLVTGATTVQLWLSTHFGTSRQKDQRVTLRLRDAKETILVGEFEVK